MFFYVHMYWEERECDDKPDDIEDSPCDEWRVDIDLGKKWKDDYKYY